MADPKYTHALARLTVNGEKFEGTAKLTEPTTIIPDYEYEAAKTDLSLSPSGWIIVSEGFEVEDSEILDATLEIGARLENGKEVYRPAVPVRAIKA